MAKRSFRTWKSILALVVIVGGAWALQQWMYEAEVIRIDGNIVTVIDGDSFKSEGAEFRIYGIDAPEYRQTCDDGKGAQWPCGRQARAGLDKHLRGGDFSCEVQAKDQFGRLIVICTDAKKTDLGSYLVEQGLAISGSHFDEVYYGNEESAAKKAKRGIWRGAFVSPDIWREQNPRK